MSIREQAGELINEFHMCSRIKPKSNVIGFQIEKDVCESWAIKLNNDLAWAEDSEIAESYYQLESRMKKLKEKIIIEVLTHGV